MSWVRKIGWHLPISFTDRRIFSDQAEGGAVMSETQTQNEEKKTKPRRDYRTETLVGVDILLVDRVTKDGFTMAKLVKVVREEDGSSHREDLSKEFLVMDFGPEDLTRALEQSQRKARQHLGLEPMPRRGRPLIHRMDPHKLKKAQASVTGEESRPRRGPSKTKAQKKAEQKARDRRRRQRKRASRVVETWQRVSEIWG